METVLRIIFCGVIGALLCAVLTTIVFGLGATMDGTRALEAFAFGAAAGIVASIFGAAVAVVVSAAKLGLAGGAAAGVLATAAAAAIYVVSFGRPGQTGYFVRASAVIVVVLLLPAVLTGVLTALLNRRLLARKRLSEEI